MTMNKRSGWRILGASALLGVLVACGASSVEQGGSQGAPGQNEPTGASMQATAEAGMQDGGLTVTVVERPGVRCIVVRGNRSIDSMRMSCNWGAR